MIVQRADPQLLFRIDVVVKFILCQPLFLQRLSAQFNFLSGFGDLVRPFRNRRGDRTEFNSVGEARSNI